MLSCLFRRRNMELYNTIQERDIDIKRDCFIGETSKETQGVRIKYAYNL